MLARPVMAGAVILDPDRESMDWRIQGIDVGGARPVARRNPRQVRGVGGHRRPGRDRSHQHPPSDAAGQCGVQFCPGPPARCSLVDAFRIPSLPMAQRGVIGGDRRSAAIAAALDCRQSDAGSVDARTARCDPRCRFDKHKGYATPTIWRPWRGSNTRRSIGVRSNPQHCLIPLPEGPYCAAVRS